MQSILQGVVKEFGEQSCKGTDGFWPKITRHSSKQNGNLQCDMKQGITNLGNSIFPEIPFVTDFSQAWRQLARNQLPEKHHTDEMFLFWLTTQTGSLLPSQSHWLLTHILCCPLKQLIACGMQLGCQRSRFKKWYEPESHRGVAIRLISFSAWKTLPPPAPLKKTTSQTTKKSFGSLQAIFPYESKSILASSAFIYACTAVSPRQKPTLQKQIVLNWREQKLGLSTRVWDLHPDSFIFRRLRLFLNTLLDSTAVASTAPTFYFPAVRHPWGLSLPLGQKHTVPWGESLSFK